MTEHEQILKAKEAYWRHKMSSRARVDRAGNPIHFLLTFDQWHAIWLASGKFHLRGSGAGKYCMSRFDDLGNYEVGNVFIQSFSDNVKEALTGKPRDPHAVEKLKATLANMPTRVCPHCSKAGRGGNHSRHHFDNCKRLTAS